jgi:hypothetical protein
MKLPIHSETDEYDNKIIIIAEKKYQISKVLCDADSE